MSEPSRGAAVERDVYSISHTVVGATLGCATSTFCDACGSLLSQGVGEGDLHVLGLDRRPAPADIGETEDGWVIASEAVVAAFHAAGLVTEYTGLDLGWVLLRATCEVRTESHWVMPRDPRCDVCGCSADAVVQRPWTGVSLPANHALGITDRLFGSLERRRPMWLISGAAIAAVADYTGAVIEARAMT